MPPKSTWQTSGRGALPGSPVPAGRAAARGGAWLLGQLDAEPLRQQRRHHPGVVLRGVRALFHVLEELLDDRYLDVVRQFPEFADEFLPGAVSEPFRDFPGIDGGRGFFIRVHGTAPYGLQRRGRVFVGLVNYGVARCGVRPE
ncbi:hypothetical protein [Streptomyces synnematoformans]|uniref:Uncharacterized protein n=1 Tax=Streptomyces synnematoformans TaxID=415721 RepID=A0ABN2XBY9_9ACTN